VTLLDSLLDAIVRLDGDALVMHVGEKPYVVTTSSAMNAYRGPLAWGQVELSSRILTPDAVLGMVTQILPADQRHALEDLGAIEHAIASPAGVRDRFTVVAARGGDDIWLELRRHPVAAEATPVEAPQVMAEGSATQTAAAAAVGLQEPPAPPEAAAPSSSDAIGPSEPLAVEAVEDAEAPSEPHHTIERVPVIDEVGEHAPEHVEHIVIPVTSGVETAPEVGSEETVVIETETALIEEVEVDVEVEVGDDDVRIEPERAEEAEFEIVEPEAQHAPTEADVDAMLAATAAALLSANIEPEEAQHAPAALGDPNASPEFLEVVIEEVEIPLDDAAGLDEPLDLTAALEEIPPATPLNTNTAIEPEAALEPEPEIPVELLFEEEQEAVPEAPPLAIAEEEPSIEIGASVEDAPEEAVILTVPDITFEPEMVAVEATASTPTDSTPIEQVTPEIAVEHPVSSPFPDPADATAHAAPSSAGMPGGAYEPRIAASVQEISHAPRAVVPMVDRAGRPEKPGAGARVDDQILLQILEQAAKRGATTVYVVAQSRPMVRVEGEITPLENIPALSASDIERLVATLSPGRNSNALAEGQEWISEVPQVGRVRCVTFKDHRGPGLIFRISSTLTISADHLNLPAAVRELSMQSDGLVIVTGARGSGKSTLLNSLVDLINSTRSDHMITIESEIAFVHESRKSFVSQREVPEDHAGRAAAVSAALREDPDVLVIEDVASSDVARAAIEAAGAGRLVFVSMTAASSGSAIDGLIDMLPAESRSQARANLATALRGVVGQVLLRRSAGGRTTARELLLNAPAVSAMIKEGRTAELVREQQNGQRFGMIPLAEALSALVRSGAVHPAEAYRRAPDRAALLAVLTREGVDTSFAERLA
jgi:twitching motility protein PilT